MVLDWAEDPLPVPSTPIPAQLEEGAAVFYWRYVKGQTKPVRQRGVLKSWGLGGEFAFVSGHGQPIDVLIIASRRLRLET